MFPVTVIGCRLSLSAFDCKCCAPVEEWNRSPVRRGEDGVLAIAHLDPKTVALRISFDK